MATVDFDLEGMSRDDAYEHLLSGKHDLDGKMRRYRMTEFRPWLIERELVEKSEAPEMTREQLVEAILDECFDGGSDSKDDDDEASESTTRRGRGRSRGRGRGRSKKTETDKPKGRGRRGRGRTKKNDDSSTKEDPAPSKGSGPGMDELQKIVEGLTDMLNTSGTKIDKMAKEVGSMRKAHEEGIDDLAKILEGSVSDLKVVSELVQDMLLGERYEDEKELEDRIDEILEELEEGN